MMFLCFFLIFFSTVKAKLESEKLPSAAVKAVRSPSRKRERRSGMSRTRAPLSLMAANKSRHNSSDDTSSDDEHEEAPLMTSKDSGGKSSYKSEICILIGVHQIRLILSKHRQEVARQLLYPQGRSTDWFQPMEVARAVWTALWIRPTTKSTKPSYQKEIVVERIPWPLF